MDPIRRPRGDFPGAFHHVTNRGLAHRPAFEGRADVRAFLALLAMEVHDGRLEVHAFSFLTTHFHLLLRSVQGTLSYALMRIEYRYVKRFNRLHDRDGSLFHSRFRSRIVDSDEYWFNVIRYIDANAVDAGLSSRSVEYEFASARLYCGRRAPPWLERSQVEKTVRSATRSAQFTPEAYERVFGVRLDPDERWVIERRIQSGSPNDGGNGSGDELLRAAPDHVLRWLRERAERADGGRVGLTLVAPARVQRAVREASSADPDWTGENGRKRVAAWPVVEAGLLRELCGLTLREIAELTAVSRAGAWVRCERHDAWLVADGEYGRRVQGIVRELGPSSGAAPEQTAVRIVENRSGLGCLLPP